jgi:RsiW-degrading membrane proteinase PrsW (M82 family)
METKPSERLIIPIHRPDARERTFFMLSGVLLSVPFTVFAEALATDYLSALVSSNLAGLLLVAIIAPFIEEFGKAYPLFYRHGETQRSIFVLGFLVGLGFGVSEFVVYVFALGAPVLVRLPGIFFHAASTSITAYGIATRRSPQFYMIAVLLHFSNNAFAMFDVLWYVGGVATILITYFLSWRLYHRLSERFIDQQPMGAAPPPT